jgi:hypothetical protein
VPTSTSARRLAGASRVAVGQKRRAAAGRSLDVSVQVQRQPSWCWAAVSTSLSRYYHHGSHWTQCALASRVLHKRGCCADGGAPCDRPCDLDRALRFVGVLRSVEKGAASLARVRREIDAGRVIACVIDWSFGGGHAVIIDGYSDGDQLQVRDPLFGTSTLPYQDFRTRYNAFGRWAATCYTQP